MIDELMSRDEAVRVLDPHLSAVSDSIEKGWSDWKEALQEDSRWVTASTRTRANAVYDFIAARAEAYFDSAGIETTRRNGFLVIAFAEGLLRLRFKKFRDDRLHTSGIPTQQRLEIEAQQVTLGNGMTPTFIVAGYLPDELGLDLDVIAIACPYNGEVLWQIDLREEAAASVPISVDEPLPPAVRSTRTRESGVDGQESRGS